MKRRDWQPDGADIILVEHLKQFFEDNPIPNRLRLSKCEVIASADVFLDSHLTRALTPSGKPFLDRLTKAKSIIEQSNAQARV